MNSHQNGLKKRFMNWLASFTKEMPSTNRIGGSKDFLSKLMNRISD